MDYTPNKGSKNHMEKNEEYILALEEKNRLRKLASSKSMREKQEENRERGFTTHFAGANSSKPVIAKPMVKTNQPVNPIVRVKGESRKGWAVEPRGTVKVGRGSRLDSERGSAAKRLGTVSPILQNDRSPAAGPRRSREAVEVEDDDRFVSRLGDEGEVSDEDDEETDEDGLEDSLDAAYLDNRASGLCTDSSRYSSRQDLDEEEYEEAEDDLYDEDFEDDEDTHNQQEDGGDNADEEEEEQVDFRPVRRGVCPSLPQGVSSNAPERDTKQEDSPPVRHLPSASRELDSLRVQYREANTHDKAFMRDSLEESMVRGAEGKMGNTTAPQGKNSMQQSKSKTACGGDPDVASEIAARLQALSSDQQSKLLMMLNKLETTSDLDDMGIASSATQPATASLPSTPPSDSKPSSVSKPSAETSAVTINDDGIEATCSPSASPRKKKRTKRSPRRKKNSPARPPSGAEKTASSAPEQRGKDTPSSRTPRGVTIDPVISAATDDEAVLECPDGTDPLMSDTDVTIRIKLHNSWKKAAFASLACLRLVLRGSDKEVDLSAFTVQVSTGNMVHPKSSEVVRGVSHLFARSRVAERKEWRFPVGSSIQLVLTGCIQGLVEDYELLVWNGISDATCSPVRDVDVYANTTLVWTGEVNDDASSGGHDITLQPGYGVAPSARHREYTSRSLLLSRGVARPPSNIIPLRTELTSSKRETVKNTVSPITKPRPQQSQLEASESAGGDASALNLKGVSAKSSSSFTFSGLSRTPSTGMSTTDFLALEQGAGRGGRFAVGNADEPSWLTDLKTPRDGPLSERSNTDIEFVDSTLKLASAPKKVAATSVADKREPPRSKSLDLYFAEADETVAAVGNNRPGSRRKAVAARGYAEERSDSQGLSNDEERKPFSRGSRRKAQEQQQLETSTAQTSTTPFKPRKSRRETKKEEEDKLRQSMEALHTSDRHNRGRLEQELTTAGGVRHEPLEPSGLGSLSKISEADEGTPVVSGIDISPLSLEATVAVNLTTRRMKALEELSGGALDRELSAEAGPPGGGQRKILRQRSERIEQVQEKVSTALASLAGMMSTLPGQNKRPPEHATLNMSPTHSDPGSTSGPVSNSVAVELTALNASLDGGIDDLLADSYLESSLCDIPVLPRGRVMELEVLSTWGDPYYVGLNGIDVFDHHGDIQLQNEGIDAISADPSDINILPEYRDDPRTIHNVLDGMNFTRDDLHVWLAPHGHTLSPRLPYVANITITFSNFTTVSLIRIWNYNKSRTHCYRGVRRCRIKLDNKMVFEGEIRAAPGLATSTEDCSEVILFTTDSMVLGKVAAYDMSMGYMNEDMTEEQSSSKWLEQLKGQKAYSRPRTADKSAGRDGVATAGSTILTRRKQATSKPTGTFEPSQTRPTTAAIRPMESCMSESLPVDMTLTAAESTRTPPELVHTEHFPAPAADNTTTLKKRDLFECRFLTFVIERTWGDKCYVGLAGLEVLIGQNALGTEMDATMVDAEPRDLSVIGCFDDPRTPDKLVDGVNDTTDDTHMWLIPYTAGTEHQVKIDLGATCSVAGFNVWNYNKSPEDALRGARVIAVYADGNLVGRCEVRIAPGCDGVDIRQTLMLRDISDNAMSVKAQGGLRYITPAVRQDYETPVLPSGTTWRFNLHCNWGDGYYIGLDGLQMLDENGKEILLESSHCRVAACPNSLCELGVSDSRLPRNLSCEPYSDPTGCMAWLAPLAQCMTAEERRNSLRFTVGRAAGEDFEPLFFDQNILYVFFDRPVTVSVVRFFNYSKTPKRGVREIGIDVDGEIVFMGTLRSADSQGYNPSEGQAIVFTSDPKLVRLEKSKVTYCGGTEQDVLCINERQVIVRSKAMYEQPNVSMEGIHSDLSNRPTTSLVSSSASL